MVLVFFFTVFSYKFVFASFIILFFIVFVFFCSLLILWLNDLRILILSLIV